MRQARLRILAFIVVCWVNTVHAQQDVEILIEKPDAAIQAQIQKLFNTLQKSGDDARSNIDVWREVKALKQLSTDKDKLVRQLALFVATTKSEEDSHVLVAAGILYFLDFPPSVPIRVFAPYLGTDNRQLRSFVEMWFYSHDKAANDSPPLRPVNYDDYLDYVRLKIGRGEEIPAPFIRYIYERSPGQALLVFAYAAGSRDVAVKLEAMHTIIEARKQGKEPEPQPELGQQFEERRRARSKEKREIELAEHIVSNAIWLNKNGFTDRFQAALPEANEQLDKLAKGEWWAKLYVVYIMRQNPPFLKDSILRQLAEDENKLVSEAASSKSISKPR
jgi:hypothetical protein